MFHDLHSIMAAQSSSNTYELQQLARNIDPTVRAYVAENPNTPIEVLLQLVDDKETLVHIYLLRNKNIGIEVCLKFMQSSDKAVRREASLIALRKYKAGDLQLDQKDVATIIRILDNKADVLTIIETVEDLARIRERNIK